MNLHRDSEAGCYIHVLLVVLSVTVRYALRTHKVFPRCLLGADPQHKNEIGACFHFDL